MNTKHGVAGMRWWMVALAIAALLAGSAPLVQARDRGVNQPGAAGNSGVRDPGVNQPGAVGNGAVGVGGSARQTRAVADPGRNQPGRVGNAGAAGNRPGDPGVNQPGAAGNRK